MNVVGCGVMLLALGGGVWPAFLGEGADPPAAEKIPVTWSPQENVAWKADLVGHGQSSPIVWNDLVVVTAVEGAEKETYWILAFDLASGKERWKHSLASTAPVKNSLYVSRAAPTPLADEKGIYAYFESGDAVALSHDGTPRWKTSLSERFGKFQNKFGLAASPVQTDSAVIILVDDEGPSYLVALDKQKGEVLWKTDRTSRTSWSSPGIVQVAGKPQVVCSSAGSVDGYDAATGKLLWSYDEVGGNTAATPRDLGSGRFLVGASVGREAERADNARKSNFLMEIVPQGDAFEPRIVWKTEQATPSFGSPIVHAGHAYWVNRTGVVYCFDAATGEPRYTERTKQSVWATPLGIGDRVYLFGKDGITTVLAAGPEFKVLAENRLWEPDDVPKDPALEQPEETEERRQAAANFSGRVQYGVAAVGDRLLVRTGDRLYCIAAAK